MMFYSQVKTYVIALLVSFTLHQGRAQFGPGGVGDSGEIVLWLHHGSLNQMNLSNPQWSDISGYDHHATQTSVLLPVIVQNLFGNKPGANFSGSRALSVADAVALDFSDGVTWAAVFGNRSIADVTRFVFSKGGGNTNELGYAFSAINNQINVRLSDGTNEIFDGTTYVGLNAPAFSLANYDRGSRILRISSGASGPQEFLYGSGLNSLQNSNDLIIGGGPLLQAASNWEGIIGEVILINRELNLAEEIILENYLSTVFQISTTREFYTHQANFNYELAGIGQVNGANEQNDAKGTAIVRINQPSDLDDGEYLLWAHDNEKINSGGTNENLWRVDQTGNVGTVQVQLYVAGYGITDESLVSFFVSNNANFNNATEHKPTQWDAVNEILTFENVDFGNNDYFTFTSPVGQAGVPVIDQCPLNVISRANDPGDCGAVVSWVPPISDGTLTSTHNPGDFFPVGTTTVTYTATNTEGSTSCSFNVSVSDNESPIFSSCPSNVILSASGGCNQTVNWTTPSATDNCNVTITSTHNPGDNFSVGTTTVSYTATDAAGNSTSCSFDVVIQDTEPPVLSSCPTDITLIVNGSCDQSVSWTPPTATDNCNVTVTSTHSSGDRFAFGTTTVTYTATDDAGNSVTCSFQVAVIDDEPPVITNCPRDILVQNTANCQESVSWVPPGVRDNCNVTLTSSHNPNDLFPVGITTVTYTATDESGNRVTCSFEVTVTDDADPVFSNCNPTVTITDFQAGSQDAVAQWVVPTVRDNCEISEFIASHNPGDRFPIGTTLVTYKADDVAGNGAECSFEVVVVAVNTAPVVEPLALTVNAGETVTICLQVKDPEGDNVSLKDVNAVTSAGTISAVDANAWCFDYSAPKEFEGIETIEAVLCDDGDPSECTIATVEVKIEIVWELDISQLVTPNNDGVNDTWFIGNIDKYPVNQVFIFDRWGSAIYQAQNYNNNTICWSGNSERDHAKPGGAPSGTYFYQIELGDGRSFKGFIELVDP